MRFAIIFMLLVKQHFYCSVQGFRSAAALTSVFLPRSVVVDLHCEQCWVAELNQEQYRYPHQPQSRHRNMSSHAAVLATGSAPVTASLGF
jgi:hypothetical protein